MDNPVLFIFLASLLVFAVLAAIVLWDSRRVYGMPRERWFERLSFWAAINYERWPHVTPWADALATIGEWTFNAFTNHRLIDELNDVHGRLGALLCEATGGKASKSNYSSETMSSLVQEYQTEMLEDHVVDTLARLPNFDFPWKRIKLLCEYAEVSEGAVSERRKHIKDMAALMKATRREREKAAAKVRGRVSLGNGLTRNMTKAEAASVL